VLDINFEKKKAGYSHAACYTDKYEDGWKAALSWIYYDICPEAWDVGDVEFDIEQELNIAKSFQNSQKPLKEKIKSQDLKKT